MIFIVTINLFIFLDNYILTFLLDIDIINTYVFCDIQGRKILNFIIIFIYKNIFSFNTL